MSFQERAKFGMEKLYKQHPITLKKAREQAQHIKTNFFREQEEKCMAKFTNEMRFE